MRWWLPAIVLAAGLASAQQPGTQTVFDEIDDARERAAFRELWEQRDPVRQRSLSIRFVESFPRSIVLRDAYEVAARGSAAAGDVDAALVWAQRSLRLMPENPFLLAMVADLAARRSERDLASRSAEDVLRLLTHSVPPVQVPPAEWPRMRDQLLATARLALGRVAAARAGYSDAEALLLAALQTHPEDMESVYMLGLVRAALKDDRGAGAALAHVFRSNGPWSRFARLALLELYGRRTNAPHLSFDEYVASFVWTRPSPAHMSASRAAKGASGADAADTYAGSAACGQCHARQYANWQATGMARMFRPYRAADVIGDFSARTIPSSDARPLVERDRHFIEIRNGETREWIRYAVDYLIGSKWQQAYATRLPDETILVFPIQYSRVHSQWLNYWKLTDAPGSPRANVSRFHERPSGAIYQSACAPCHTSQLRFSSGIDRPATGTFREPGINCEMCHGPSRRHVEWMQGSRTSGGAASATPVEFSRLTATESVAICAQCHAQSAVHDAEPGGAANYSEEGGHFYRSYSRHLMSDFTRRAFYRDGRHRATTFIVEAFTRSRCFKEGGATCGSCHDVHPSNAASNPASLKFAADSNDMCTQCHSALAADRGRHARHPPGTEANRCVSCHMPRIMDALLFPARTHEIDDVPDAAMTARFGSAESPNACLACHADRDTAWLERARPVP